MNFDLNIENYTRDELIDMFELPQNFDKNIVEIKETKLKDSIVNNKQINKETQVKTMNFLSKAKNIILNGNKHDGNNSNNNDKGLLLPLSDDEPFKSYYELKQTPLDNTGDHAVQDPPFQKPHISSYPSEFYAGIINPIKKRLITRSVVIDTRFRDNYYASSASNFTMQLPTNFNNIVQMELTAVEIPYSYYAISKAYGNNYFNIVVDGNSAVVKIPDGNYDSIAVTTAINTELNNLGAPFNQVAFNIQLNESTVISSYLIGSNKIFVGTISGSTITSIELNFQYNIEGQPDLQTQLPTKLGWMLGFRNGYYTGSLHYVTEGVVDVFGPKYIYLIVDDYNNNVVKNYYSMLNSSILNNNILARFPTFPVKPFNFYIANSLTNTTAPPRHYFGPVNILNLHIQLTDEYGRTIDLNNMDYCFTLTLTTIYDL